MTTYAERRPWATAGVALAAASMVAAAPMALGGGLLPRVDVPDIQLAGLGSDVLTDLGSAGFAIAMQPSVFAGTVLALPVALVTDPANIGNITSTVSGNFQGLFNMLPSLAAGFANGIVGPVAGPLSELSAMFTGGGLGSLIGAPEHLLDVFLTGGAAYPNFLADILGPFSAGLLSPVGGPLSVALAPLGVLESVTNTGFLPAMSMNALPDGLFSSAADVLDQLLSTNILGNAVGDINNFLAGGMTDIANGINTLGTYLGDGLQSVLGTFISNTGGIDILFDHIGTLLLAAPQILLQLLL